MEYIFYGNNTNNNLNNQYALNDPTSYSITVNTAGHSLTLYKNGLPYKNYPVAVGKPSTPTPKGQFEIINKEMNPGGPYGVRWLGLNKPGIGIHGTNQPSLIGKSVSHGCIRMFNKDVIELYQLVPIGTPVKII
jgi:lipoprotein-anchoring transpeptidase ErfK/SrfK